MIPSAFPATLLGVTLGVLAEAEQAGIVEARDGGIGFRHELARRAVEQSLPELRRRLLNAEVVGALRLAGVSDRARLLHHAVAAGDVATLLAEGPAAAQEAARAGSHRQALAHYEAVIEHAPLLDERARADVFHAYGWELYNAARFVDAVQAGRAAQAAVRGAGRRTRPGVVPGAAVAAAADGGRDRRGARRGPARGAAAGRQRARGLVPGRDPGADGAGLGGDAGARARGPARGRSRPARSLRAGPELPGDRARGGGRSGRGAGHDAGQHRAGAGRRPLRGARPWLRQPRRAARARGPVRRAGADGRRRAVLRPRARVLVARLQPRRAPLRVAAAARRVGRGRSRAARAGRGRGGDTGFLYAYSVPWLGRLLARRGDPAADAMLAEAWTRAKRARTLVGVAYAGLARVEWAWLAEDVAAAREVRDELLPRLPAPRRRVVPRRAPALPRPRGSRRAGAAVGRGRDPPVVRVGGGPRRRVAHRGGALAARRRSLRDGARARAQRRTRRDRGRARGARPARRDAGRGARAHRAPRARRARARAARTRPRAATRPGSPSASWRCWRSCATG